MRNLTRDAFNEEAVNYSVEKLYSVKKEEFLTKVKQRVNDNIQNYGIKIEQFGFVGALRIPENVINALNAKIEATQNAIWAEINEKALAKWNGEVPSVVSGSTGSNLILQLPGLNAK